ncbi:MAG: TIGR03620 family F420-dependent LLM class oxidoreductase [Chloroflexi bacterium]|nr:TIGR03620 family F420-dependent LLM class oxidoreductase [Chloroflexota bacterium]
MTSAALDAIGPLGVWGHIDSLPVDGVRAYARRVEELGFGALWVPETVGREPFALLALASTATERLVLGTSIASIYARDAVTMRTAAMTLHEATGGRFILGLGVSHPHLVSKVRGHEYTGPVSTMRAYLDAYRGAPYTGPRPIDQPETEPPVIVAALRERMTALGATEADGAFPYLVTPERVGQIRRWLDSAAPSGARRPFLAVTVPAVLETDPARARDIARMYLAPYLRTPNYRASWGQQGFSDEDWEKPGSDRLVDAMIAWGDADALRERIEQMSAGDADHVAVIPLSPDGSTEHLPTLEALAPRG